MRNLILLAGAMVLAATAPAHAKPGKGQGQGQGKPHAHGVAGPVGYGVGGCPPGLANKGCMPPGQAKHLFAVGQRVPLGYNGLIGYNALPRDLRTYYGPQLDPGSRYVYDGGYVYRVDPRTLMVQQILNGVLRP